MRKAVLVLLAGAMLAVPGLGPASAQEAPPPAAKLGRTNSDPAGCRETSGVIRQLYAECAGIDRSSVLPRPGGSSASGRPVPQPAPAATPPARSNAAPLRVGRQGEEGAPDEARVATSDRHNRMPDTARCRSILLKGQLGEELSDVDRAYLRERC